MSKVFVQHNYYDLLKREIYDISDNKYNYEFIEEIIIESKDKSIIYKKLNDETDYSWTILKYVMGYCPKKLIYIFLKYYKDQIVNEIDEMNGKFYLELLAYNYELLDDDIIELIEELIVNYNLDLKKKNLYSETIIEAFKNIDHISDYLYKYLKDCEVYF